LNMRLKKILLSALLILSSLLLFVYFIIGVPDIDVKIVGPNKSSWGDTITYTITVTNKGNRDLIDVNVSDSTCFNWVGILKVGASETFLIDYKIPVKDKVVNTVIARGYSKRRELVEDKDSWTINIPTGIYSLTDAVNEGYINVEFRGTGHCSGDSVELDIKSNIDLTLKVEIKPGLILVNSGAGQNMVTAVSVNITVKPDAELYYTIEAYCLDMHKDNPSRDEVFSVQVGWGSYSVDVLNLMRSLKDAPTDRKSVSSIQIALWVITDNISVEELRVPFIDEDIQNAKWLLENAGITTSNKQIF